MKARDIFGVVIRTLGLCLLLFSLWFLVFGLFSFLRIVPTYSGDERWYADLIFPGIPGFLAAILLLRFSRYLVRFCYPKDRDDTET